MNPFWQQKPFPLRRLLALVLLLALCAGCATSQVGGPTAPRGDPAAGLLTLPSGHSVSVYPADLAYTGVAIYRWPDGREYLGAWHNGKPEGLGAETLPSGEHYHGTWHAGQRDGHGELTSADGTRYVGDFTAGRREGSGSERSDRGIYRGSWAEDLPNGNGAFFSSNGASYQGGWRNGVREGHGSYSDGHDNTYEGDWSDDAPNGFGRMTSAAGTVYQGQLRDGERQGYGRLDAGSFSYEGTWRDGKRHGYGHGETPDGSSYLGGWQNDNRHGIGRASHADGSYYDGEWIEDQPLGPGTRVDASGIKISGVWDRDRVSAGRVELPGGATYTGDLMGPERSVAPKFVRWLETLSVAGNAHAQLFLGIVLSDSLDPAPDQQRALSLFLSAARGGVAEAAYRAALIITADSAISALQITRDSAADQHIRLLAQAAAAGHSNASLLLGEHYATGTYVMQDASVAVTYFTQASERGNLAARNDLAWILATYPDDMIRDGNRALALIEPLAILYDNWQHLDTLAAAYAELGEFELAVATEQRALELASSIASDERELDSVALNNMRVRLTLYQQGQRFRESADAPQDGI